MSKEEFKAFVQKHPQLLTRVHEKEFTWQELYEAYDIYGEKAPVFQEKRMEKGSLKTNYSHFHEFSELLKNVDLDAVQKGVNGLQKAVSLLQEIGSFKEIPPQSYEERPIYKYYED